MSFIARSIRPVARASASVAVRPISSSAVRSKTVTESAKDTLDSVRISYYFCANCLATRILTSVFCYIGQQVCRQGTRIGSRDGRGGD